MQIDGVAAVVTGGSSGLGAATAACLAKAGATVTIFDLNREMGEAHGPAIGGNFVAVDVTDEDAVGEALQVAEAVNGKVRILVNCAGTAPPRKVIARDGRPIPLGDFAKLVTEVVDDDAVITLGSEQARTLANGAIGAMGSVPRRHQCLSSHAYAELRRKR